MNESHGEIILLHDVVDSTRGFELTTGYLTAVGAVAIETTTLDEHVTVASEAVGLDKNVTVVRVNSAGGHAIEGMVATKNGGEPSMLYDDRWVMDHIVELVLGQQRFNI